MGDREDIAAESRAYGRRLPFMMAGGLLILLGVGLIGVGLDRWPYVVGVVALGIAAVLIGEWRARR